jgi:hypothetical protein
VADANAVIVEYFSLADPANDSDRYGRHKYTFAPFGVDWDQLSPTYDRYRARYLGKADVAP